LTLSDIYLFSSKDPNQAVSGTLAYALSCGCPVISTPIPHAKEIVDGGGFLLSSFEDSEAFKEAILNLL
jgi:glycosyltransferase involved in cell wall biosynthesis